MSSAYTRPNSTQARKQNQLHILAQQGLFTEELPADLSSLPRLPNPFDPSVSLDQRARSYLHVNCAPCHRPESVGRTIIDLRYDTPLAATNTVGAFPTLGDLGELEALIITPGAPQHSTLYLRMLTLGTFRMPPLASSIIDERGADLIAEWVASLDLAAAKETTPATFALIQNYPNPFNATTTIEFQLAAPATVELDIYDAIGQKVRTLVARLSRRRTLPHPVGRAQRRRPPSRQRHLFLQIASRDLPRHQTTDPAEIKK